MISRILGILAIAWTLGFAAFMLALGQPLGDDTTDAIVVPTGGTGRLARALDVLAAHRAHRLLVTGVAPGVDADDLADQNRGSRALFACCVDLGGEAVDTRSNAREAAQWVRAHGYHSVRLVTSDYHLARAAMELRAALGPGVVVLTDGVRSQPRLGLLVNEYNKLILRRIALWAGL